MFSQLKVKCLKKKKSLLFKTFMENGVDMDSDEGLCSVRQGLTEQNMFMCSTRRISMLSNN